MIGVGCDIVKISRMGKLMKHEQHTRFLTAEELVLYEQVSSLRKCEWLAGRFAAKEAVIKAMSSEVNLLLSDISILYDDKRVVCSIPGYLLHLSIAHEEDYAIAYVIAQKE